MLDTATKRRIDSARDILVGKVPDPKSQVEQITIALIYKFMDDMDAEAEELGGKRSFFTGDFARFGWAKLMRSGLGGHETLGLYAEAITRMPENPGVPALFREIFKNAYLPYRDPETLRAFLKIIDEFEYDHSERLGDAFEYLLSVLGSQGDAGQFRTPRHIIDFIVAIVDPKKGETILDPACGTAGFLISAWKHIQAANRDADGDSTLSPDEQARLATNIKGYDISPDMVRLSLANMYLHGFADPHIVEYDTLTSDERWNEYADVILANPPFMSPKGGIRPHNRFSIQANRSEVLFVDYMAEHLTPSGRAGIIVPEGVIFQSGKAYKALRKELVEKYLVAVISLPAGVFNPYSGVKTSILILDRAAAKASATIGIFKIGNDGFGLGAQRREVAGSELTEVLAEIADYRAHAGDVDWEGRFGTAVAKAEIAASGDYNISGERYRRNGDRASIYELMPFDDVCTLEYGASLPKEKRIDGPYPVVGSNGVTGNHSAYLVEGPAIVVGRKGSAGEVTWIEENCFPIDTTYYAKLVDHDAVDLRYLYRVLKSLDLPHLRGGAGIPGLNRSDVYATHKIPLPPLEVQREIVAEIEGYQKVVDGARAVVENYRPQIAVDPMWPKVELSEAAVNNWGNTNLTKSSFVEDGPFLGVSAAGCDGRMNHAEHEVGTLVLSAIGANCGRMFRPGESFTAIKNTMTISPKEAVAISGYLFAILPMTEFPRSGGAQPFITKGDVQKLKIPLPPIETQREIVADLEAERALVDANRELIGRMEKKSEAAIARVWGAAEAEPAQPAIAAE